MKLDIILREAVKDDMSFIYDSWMRSFRKAGTNKLISDDYYKAWQSKRIEQAFRADSKIVIACEANNINQIIGWLCFTVYEKEPVIHFIYVKAKFRLSGLAKMLMTKAGFTKDIITTSITYITNTKNSDDIHFSDRYNIIYLPDLVTYMVD